MFIAVQRLILMRWPFKVSILLTRKRCFIVMISIWIASLTISLLILFGDDTYYRVYLCTLLAFGYVVLVLYTILNLKTQTRRVTSSTNSSAKQNRNVMLYSTAITLIFLVCTFPYTIFPLGKIYTPNIPSYAFYSYILQVAFDPLLYFLFHYLKAKNTIQIVEQSDNRTEEEFNGWTGSCGVLTMEEYSSISSRRV